MARSWRLEVGGAVSLTGLGLPDVTTTLGADKITSQRSIAWDGGSIDGYEIHPGRTEDWGVAIEAAIDQVAALVTESGWAEHLGRAMDR